VTYLRYQCARLPGGAEAGRQIQLPGLYEETAHARKVGKKEDIVGIEGLSSAIQKRGRFMPVRRYGLV
jgi:hypothetical protein